jgi:hypothetical protein
MRAPQSEKRSSRSQSPTPADKLETVMTDGRLLRELYSLLRWPMRMIMSSRLVRAVVVECGQSDQTSGSPETLNITKHKS